jgi:hypothetical protein
MCPPGWSRDVTLAIQVTPFYNVSGNCVFSSAGYIASSVLLFVYCTCACVSLVVEMIKASKHVEVRVYCFISIVTLVLTDVYLVVTCANLNSPNFTELCFTMFAACNTAVMIWGTYGIYMFHRAVMRPLVKALGSKIHFMSLVIYSIACWLAVLGFLVADAGVIGAAITTDDDAQVWFLRVYDFGIGFAGMTFTLIVYLVTSEYVRLVGASITAKESSSNNKSSARGGVPFVVLRLQRFRTLSIIIGGTVSLIAWSFAVLIPMFWFMVFLVLVSGTTLVLIGLYLFTPESSHAVYRTFVKRVFCCCCACRGATSPSPQKSPQQPAPDMPTIHVMIRSMVGGGGELRGGTVSKIDF